jgi:molybdopterin molybdotransferase
MLSFDEAQRRLLALAKPLGAERVALDAALGRVLAEEVRVAGDLPVFDVSTMDGYAVSADDFHGEPPWRLKVHGESRAGAPFAALASETTCRIFTGARVPEGATAVVPQEEVARDGAWALFEKRPRRGECVRLAGDDLRAGQVALRPGVRLRARHLSLAAAADRAWLAVTRKPQIALLATGDELRPPGSQGPEGSIPDSIAVALASVAHNHGCVARVLPLVRDDRDALTRVLDETLDRADVLVTIGGASVGDHDHVRPCLEAAGVTLDFYRVAIKPGKPLIVGRRGSSLVLGLPGNPVSAMVTFALFGVPLLGAMSGLQHPVGEPTKGSLGRRIERVPGKREFLRARIERRGRDIVAHPVPNQASGAVTSIAHADALIVVPENVSQLAEGDDVDLYLLDELGL